MINYLEGLVFFIHDSTKGHSAGCIEIESTLFDDLKVFMADKNKMAFLRVKGRLVIKVEYSSKDMITNGRTGTRWIDSHSKEKEERIQKEAEAKKKEHNKVPGYLFE